MVIMISRNNNWIGKKYNQLWPFKTMINRINDYFYRSLPDSLISPSCAHVGFCAFYVVSASLIPPGCGAAAAKSRAVQHTRLQSATRQRPCWPDTSTWPHVMFMRGRIGTLAEGYLLILLLRHDLPTIFFRGGVVLMEQPPFDVELTALGHMMPFGINSKKKNQARVTEGSHPKMWS